MSISPDTPAAAPADGTGGASRSARVKEFGSQLHQMIIGGDDCDPPPADEQPTPKFDAGSSAQDFDAGRYGGAQPVQPSVPMGRPPGQRPIPATDSDWASARTQAGWRARSEARTAGAAQGRAIAAMARPPVPATVGIGGLGGSAPGYVSGMSQSDVEASQ
jgi:hypothetical protein